MRSSPLYALLCFQLAFAPAAFAAGQPTWEAKRAHMASEIKEALGILDNLDKWGPPCSDNYVKSQCPKTMPQPPKQSFVEAARRNLKAVEQEVAALAAEAKIADAPFDEKKLASVDSCAGAGAASATDAAKRKAAVDKMSVVFAKVNAAVAGDLNKLFDAGPKFVSLRDACAAEVSSFSFLAKSFLPKSPHEALQNLWARDNNHPQCPANAKTELLKLTGAGASDGKSTLGGLAQNGKEYSAILAKSSADLAKFTQLAANKVDCKSADPTQLAAKPADKKDPTISGNPEEKSATLAAAEKKPEEKPTEQKTVVAEKPEQKPAEKKPDQPVDDGGGVTKIAKADRESIAAPANTPVGDPVVPEPTPLTPDPPPADQTTGLSKGHVIAGLAVLGVGAGAAYLIFSKKDKGSDSGGRIPSSTGTNTVSATQTGTQTNSGTGTQTSTSTSSEPTSSIPHTDTLTSTDVTTDTSTSTESGTQTSTATNTSSSTDTRE